MNITIHGTGYVGLVTGVCLAELGHNVMCVDIDSEKIDKLTIGLPSIFEAGLDALLRKNQSAGRIHFTTNADRAVEHADVQIIAVGTPQKLDGSADLHYVDAVADTIAGKMQVYKLIINKSTVPVGTRDRVYKRVEQVLKQRAVVIDFDVASNPEFLKEGCAINDFLHPDRIVIGVDTQKSLRILEEVYKPLTAQGYPLIAVKPRSAELIKYAANCFLATKISFMNEMAMIAEKVEADIKDVQLGLSTDPRIGAQFLNAGCGFGGSCFPKDILALKSTAESEKVDVPILNAVITTNNKAQSFLLNKINAHFKGDLKNKTITLWGLSFKPNTDDIRSASSLKLIEQLWDVGALVKAYDPMAMSNVALLYPNHSGLALCKTKEAALDGSDALVIVTEWAEFLQPDFSLIKFKLNNPVIVDGRNIYDPAMLREMGFAYYCIGRNGISVLDNSRASLACIDHTNITQPPQKHDPQTAPHNSLLLEK